MGKTPWIEQWLDPGDVLKEVEVDQDVFYDYFLSIPTVKCQRNFKEYKARFLAQIKEGDKTKFAQEVACTDDEDLESLFARWQKLYGEWEEEKSKLHGEWEEEESRFGVFDQLRRFVKTNWLVQGKRDESERITIAKKVRRIEKEMTAEIRVYFKEKVSDASALFMF